MINIKTFDDCLEISNNTGKPRHLLIGNGFSRACRNDIFSYSSLFDSANFTELPPNISKIFTTLETTDFEKVINALDFCHQVLSVYRDNMEELIKEIKIDSTHLKDILVETIASHHPSNPSDINNNEYNQCMKFLSNFKKVYSTNYDMLLYWTTMKAIEIKNQKWDDGFRDPYDGDPKDYYEEDYVEWQNSAHQQNIHYLHGALHLFYDGASLQKYCWSRKGQRLLEQIDTALKNRKYPLIVAEGSWKQKLEKIQRSNYLGHNYRSLGAIKGNLFIYGLSLSENDDHIIKQIRKNRTLTSVYVSLYGCPESPTNKKLILNSEKMTQNRLAKSPLNIYFYSAESASVWK